MALTSALNTSFAGLRNTESKIFATSSNVANADKPGYTRKEIETNYITINDQTVAYSSTLETVNFDEYMFENLIDDTSTSSYHEVISNYLSQYVAQLGTSNGDDSLSAYLDDFSQTLGRLIATPEDASLKSNVVDSAEIVARELNRISDQIQDYRLQVDEEIERLVVEINDLVQEVHEINNVMTAASVSGASTAHIEDDRRVALEKLSKLVDIDYFENSEDRIQIYAGGFPLLGFEPRTIDYTALTALDKNVLYPAGFAPIDLSGVDMTTVLTGGEIAGLIEMRDNLLVAEQAKMDEFANVLMTEVNRISNQGASFPARASFVGDVTGITAGDALAGTGNFRLATVDANGVVQNFSNFNMAGYATVGAMIADINATLGPDVTASLTGDGRLQIAANNAGEGVSINELTSSVGPDNLGTSHYFGLNNVFDGTGADDVNVSDYLANNTEFLAVGVLSASATLAIGDVGITPGNSTISTAIQDVLTTGFSFNAAGNFAAQTETLDRYMDKIISDAAFASKNGQEKFDISSSLMNDTKATLENLSGVNIDEEMAYLIDLEAKYEASATVVATLQELFDTLLGALR